MHTSVYTRKRGALVTMQQPFIIRCDYEFRASIIDSRFERGNDGEQMSSLSNVFCRLDIRGHENQSLATLGPRTITSRRPNLHEFAGSKCSLAASGCNVIFLRFKAMLGLTQLSNYLTLKGSFSAVSKPNFASKYALESSRRDLQNALPYTVL